MREGQIVKFVEPEDENEAQERYIVLENRGDRVLLEALHIFDDWYLKPTFVYQVADLELAE